MIILPINAILHGQSYTRPEIDAALAQKQSTLTFDNTPTANSNNPVKSGGIRTELDGKLPIAENQENAPVGYVLTKTSTGSQWQRASSEGGTIAAAANSYPVTLLASDWSGNSYGIAAPATITADSDGILGLAPNASAAQVEAFQLAKIVVTSQDANGITVVARGQVPTINLNLELTLFMKADYYTTTEEDALLATKAPLASPALTGTPTAPTATSGTSTTQLATTAFVQNHSNLYGVCSTAAATAAKEVTIDYSGTLTLFAGLTVHVKFSNANAAENPTLNVNGTGAVSIAQYGTTTIPKNTTWPGGSVVTFVYDGTSWIMQSLPQMAGLIQDGLGIPNTADLDDYVNTGWYWYNTAPTNAPTTASYCGLHVERSGVNIKQTVYRGNYGNPDAPAEWVRYKYSTSAWKPWVQRVTQMLAADLALHVNATSGNDSNDGLTTETALKTINAAVAKIPKDTAGRVVVINLAAVQNDDTYAAASIDGFNGVTIIVQKESSVSSADSVIVQGATITNNAH